MHLLPVQDHTSFALYACGISLQLQHSTWLTVSAVTLITSLLAADTLLNHVDSQHFWLAVSIRQKNCLRQTRQCLAVVYRHARKPECASFPRMKQQFHVSLLQWGSLNQVQFKTERELGPDINIRREVEEDQRTFMTSA